ncbi:hypothetical protein KBY58_09590 [Cyanobium sp. HWJ4-Hawea]|uniref:hypothetical protein n=1 Tax=Cyanobium sp. HWJ4-Hawea TaxID=2823713 RepID=UPI0020CDC537|nr:hypothetical protein [Cyanobium sp. HWJ4-Hawea]MCP9809683.1 hypothetical protein [Cyanobium sp. HWJ4-Hawea]
MVALAGVANPSVLSLQGITFTVSSKGEGSQRDLTIKTKGTKKPLAPIQTTIDGSISGVAVADLNSNGLPEIYVFVSGAGSGSYGSVVGYAVNRGSGSITPINLPELAGKMAVGYMGHDTFKVVENRLTRSFPVYRPGDINAKPTGGSRQINYQLVAGEASWQLKPVSVYSFK